MVIDICEKFILIKNSISKESFMHLFMCTDAQFYVHKTV